MRQAIPIVPLAPLVAGTKGRGTHASAAHRFERWEREACDDGWGSNEGTRSPGPSGPVSTDEGNPDVATSALPRTEVTLEPARSILTRNNSPDIGFDVSINPYRGCEHPDGHFKFLHPWPGQIPPGQDSEECLSVG